MFPLSDFANEYGLCKLSIKSVLGCFEPFREIVFFCAGLWHGGARPFGAFCADSVLLADSHHK
ncbi:MAG TPA: hypothetical protein VGJ00_00435 [Rhabdochlamydiaceae bacterium]